MSEARQLIAARFARRDRSYLRLGPEQERSRAAVLAKIGDGRYRFSSRPCQLCGADDFLVVAERDRYSLPVRTVLCRSCGLLMTNPVMRAADYADFYQNHYTTLYEGFQFPVDEFFENQQAAGRRLHETVKLHVDLSDKVVAEVGCAAGGILFYLQRYCKRVTGCDYGTAFLKKGLASGLDLKTGGVATLQEEHPDVFLYSHVLEHVYDIGAELEQVHGMLPAKGLLIVDVPGVFNIEQAYEADYLSYLQNAHLLQFTARTLSTLLARHAFRAIHVDERCIGIYEKAVPGTVAFAFDSDEHRRILAYLNRIEGRYLLYKLKGMPRKWLVSVLKALGIHGAVRAGYRKLFRT
ncbi:MAG TPA: methyltransferase domain-containing protein [Burkholderiales bacterium]|jgi:SAM-dependent methyltransferase|nr:methyltransferase domain-containing protein [Burkholderiales bacterium]